MRYGRNQVRLWRFTTIGNNLVSAGLLKQDDFLAIYQATYESVKSVDDQLLLGGPGGIGSSVTNSKWLRSFFEFSVANNCIPDFICTQCYPHHSIEQDRDFLTFTKSQDSIPTVLSGDEHYTKHLLRDYQLLLEEYHLEYLSVWIDEWNSTLWQRDIANDTCYKSSWLAMNLCENMDASEAFGYWLLTDFIEERADFGNVFHGGPGLFTYNGIPKSGWFSIQLLNMLGDILVASGDGWIVTRKNGCIQILLTHFCHYDRLYRLRYQRLTDVTKAYNVFVQKGRMNYTLHIFGLIPGQYEMQTYSISLSHGSSFDAWIKMGAPQYLRASETAYLKSISQVAYHIESLQLSDNYLLERAIEPHEVQLIQISPTEQFVGTAK